MNFTLIDNTGGTLDVTLFWMGIYDSNFTIDKGALEGILLNYFINYNTL